MIKLICPICSRDWKESGHSYKRNVGEKIDYYCTGCGGKKKPIRVSEKQHNMLKHINTRYDLPMTGLDGKTSYPEPASFTNSVDRGNILVIGDIHEPFCLAGYMEFCKEIYDKYNCNQVVFTGDLIDNHYASFHITDPDGLGGGDELDFAIKKIQAWKNLFPYAKVCLGNHDKIILRQAFKAGISKRWIRDFNDVLKVDWEFEPSFIINDILFRHGIGQKASPKAGSEFMNVIQGHYHTESYIQYKVGLGKMVFGAQCPCGIDRKAYALAYAEEHPKPAIGCMAVLENGTLPILEMMPI